jgi:hypothetical protein
MKSWRNLANLLALNLLFDTLSCAIKIHRTNKYNDMRILSKQIVLSVCYWQVRNCIECSGVVRFCGARDGFKNGRSYSNCELWKSQLLINFRFIWLNNLNLWRAENKILFKIFILPPFQIRSPRRPHHSSQLRSWLRVLN